jgi:hypothetical protein
VLPPLLLLLVLSDPPPQAAIPSARIAADAITASHLALDIGLLFF